MRKFQVATLSDLVQKPDPPPLPPKGPKPSLRLGPRTIPLSEIDYLAWTHQRGSGSGVAASFPQHTGDRRSIDSPLESRQIEQLIFFVFQETSMKLVVLCLRWSRLDPQQPQFQHFSETASG